MRFRRVPAAPAPVLVLALAIALALTLAVSPCAPALAAKDQAAKQAESTVKSSGSTTRKSTASSKTKTKTDTAQSEKSKPARAKPDKSKTDAAKPQPDKAAKKPVSVTDVQIWSGKDYSRIAVILSGEVVHRWQLLPTDPKDDGVRRLYVDMEDSVKRPGVPDRFTVRGDVARKVRLTPFKPGVMRLVVEVENLADQKVFVLENPYRIIVDVQGRSRKDMARAESGQKAKDRASAASGDKAPGATKAGDAPAAPQSPLATPARKKMARQLVEQLGLTVRSVMIDAGHGGKDPGAHGPGNLLEKDVNLKVARLVGKRLEKMGFTVMYTRTQDKFVSLEGRTAMANARKADLFLSIHCNAHPDPGSSGLETYSLNLASTPDEVRVAARENAVDPRRISDMQKILDELMHASKLTESRDFARAAHQGALGQARKSLNLRDRGVHEAPFYVLLGAKMPAILIEVGYITNPAEAAKLRDEKYLDGLAAGIADGVAAYKDKIERYAAQ